MKTAYAPPSYGRRAHPQINIIPYSPLTSDTYFYTHLLHRLPTHHYTLETILKIINILLENQKTITTPEKIHENLSELSIEDICYIVNQLTILQAVFIFQ
jgi:hypothetical protein